MIARRIIPLFLLRGSRLVKGTYFKNHIDVGDPISQAMIYDAQGADEIIILDIDATKENRTIDTGIISEIIRKCRLPIAAGGGIKSIADARRCFHAGADKIVVNTQAVLEPSLVRVLADEFGSQSVVVAIDVLRRPKGELDIYVRSGTQKAKGSFEKILSQVIENGAGEIVVTAIQREGALKGFDLELYNKLRPIIPVPFIACGGAGSYDHLVDLFQKTGCDGCGIGKMLFLRDYDIVRIKSYLKGRGVAVRDA